MLLRIDGDDDAHTLVDESQLYGLGRNLEKKEDQDIRSLTDDGCELQLALYFDCM